MARPLIHGSRGFVPASTLLQAIADSLSAIRRDDKLTYADIGAAIGKSEDQAAKYCDGSATMDACTFLRACTFWNGRFANGPLAHIGQVVCHEDVGSFDQPVEQFATARAGHIEPDRAFTPVGNFVHEIGAALGNDPAGDQPALRIATLGVFDLDDVGAPFGKDRARAGDESPRGHFDHPDPGKYIVHRGTLLAQTLPITSSPNPASVSGGAKSQNHA